MLKKVSKLTYIQKYVVLKIFAKDWYPGFTIPSENQLAIKFSCSRLTARQALLPFVYNNVLNTVQGSGYIVNPNFQNSFFCSMKEKIGATKITFTEIAPLKISNEILKLLNADVGNEKTFSFKKNYYVQNQLIVHQISSLNQDEIFHLDIQLLKESLSTFLLNYGIIPTSFYETTIFIKIKRFDKIAKKMGYATSKYPVTISLLTNGDQWIEIALKIIHPNYFKFSNVSRIIN